MAKQSSPAVAELIEQARTINAEKQSAVDRLAAVRALIQNYDVLGHVGTDDQPTVGTMFPRQFPQYAPTENGNSNAA